MIEKILPLKQSRKGYSSQLTKLINKVNQVIFENQNIKALKVYEYQLDNLLYEIRAITTELHDLKNDEFERKKIINFCTDQELRFVSIKDSIVNFYISNGKVREDKIFSELPSKSTESHDTSTLSSDKKASQNQISLSTRAALFALSLLSVTVILADKESQIHRILRFQRGEKQPSMQNFWQIR